MKRRDFLKASGAAAGLAVLQGCRSRDQRLFEQSLNRGAGLDGEAVWRYGVCGQCPAGCGTHVRLVDGAAKKLEGHPLHPVNQGGLCALGQSALQELYNPDRILQPMRRVKSATADSGGKAASTQDFEPISWDQALVEIATMLGAAGEASSPGAARFGVVTGGDELRLAFWRRLAQALGGRAWSWQPADLRVESVAAARVFGWQRLPYYDLSESDFVLGLGAAFLDRWRSPVHYARSLVEQRNRRRSRFVHAEPRMSLTAAAADRWLPLRPGTEGALARALAGAVMDAGIASQAAVAHYRALFPGLPPSLENAAAHCDLPLARLHSLVDQLLAAERPVVVSGGSAALHRHGLANVAAGMALNLLLAAVDRVGGVFQGSSTDLGAAIEPSAISESSAPPSGELEVLIVAECDPLHHMAPAARARLEGTRIIALASCFDDSALAADLVLPIQTDLERLDLIAPSPGPRSTVLSASPAIVESRGQARHPIDIGLAIAATRGDAEAELPWKAMEDLITAVLSERSDDLPGSAGLTPARFARQLQDNGGAWSEASDSPAKIAPPTALAATAFEEPTPEPPADSKLALTLVPFETVKTADGRGANRPWLQELPDPMSTVMWGSWVEISPVDGQRLGLGTGDRVRVARADGAVSRITDAATAEAWVFVSPAARPGTVALAMGQGYRENGRFARQRGINAWDLLADERVEGVGEDAFGDTGWAVGALGAVRVTLDKAVDRKPAPIYGRGLRQAESIPVGWAPQDSGDPTRKERA